MFKKILYPTDFSDVAFKALAVIEKLKDAGTEEVIAIHIIDQRNLDAMTKLNTEMAIEVREKQMEHIKNEMESIEKELASKGFRVKTRIEADIPFRAILKAEEEENASAIVIGSHGMSNLSEMLLGSVSEKVIRKAKKPVIVVKR
ncbi:MAG: universal stress protein [Syntrophales bacterium]|jgi:nucleotide-binding universal stress UspA family protein|nr:universal stress protein [Syntrophales bacterium]MDY0043811.1 universal stress protein [Syntrophales bacterium]